MTETYNPRDRSFIKMPEIKCCAACGQPLPSEVKPMNNHMNRYISEHGKISVMNSNEDIVSIKQGDVVVKLHKLVKIVDPVTGQLTNKEHAPTLPKPEPIPTNIPQPPKK